MTPEKLQAICDALDAVMEFSEQNRKEVVRSAKYLQSQIDARYGYAGSGERLSHSDVIRIGELEREAEAVGLRLNSWLGHRAAAIQDLEAVVGLGVRRTVNPQVQQIVKALADRGLSLKYLAMAAGLSEGTASKLRSGTYPASSFPATVKVGRRAARR